MESSSRANAVKSTNDGLTTYQQKLSMSRKEGSLWVIDTF